MLTCVSMWLSFGKGTMRNVVTGVVPSSVCKQVEDWHMDPRVGGCSGWRAWIAKTDSFVIAADNGRNSFVTDTRFSRFYPATITVSYASNAAPCSNFADPSHQHIPLSPIPHPHKRFSTSRDASFLIAILGPRVSIPRPHSSTKTVHQPTDIPPVDTFTRSPTHQGLCKLLQPEP